MKNKLELNNLSIKSFVTTVGEEDRRTILGQYDGEDLLTEKRGRICALVRVAKAFKSRPNPECFHTFDMEDKKCRQAVRDAYDKSDFPPCFPKN